MTPLKVGDRAPDLELPAHDRKIVSLESIRGAQQLLVLFFPLAFSGVCTQEICSVGSDFGAYEALDASVVAISVDSPYVLERFRADCGASFPFLSDFHREAAEAFGVLRPEPLGPGLRNTTDRSAFVIGRDGIITYAWHSKNPTNLPPFDEIKQVLSKGV